MPKLTTLIKRKVAEIVDVRVRELTIGNYNLRNTNMQLKRDIALFLQANENLRSEVEVSRAEIARLENEIDRLEDMLDHMARI